MFDRIAGRYDLLNTLMTGGLDGRWRRDTVRAARLQPGARVLDVACGTGPLARAASEAVGGQGEVVGIDFSERMLAVARRTRPRRGAASPRYVLGDALSLPFEAGTFHAVTIGFGLRNVADYRGALAEMARVAVPGRRVVVLEIALPRGALSRLLFRTWFARVVPLLGRAAGSGDAYRYLPASLRGYPEPERVAELMRDVGLDAVGWRWLAGGMVTLHVGRRPVTS